MRRTEEWFEKCIANLTVECFQKTERPFDWSSPQHDAFRHLSASSKGIYIFLERTDREGKADARQRAPEFESTSPSTKEKEGKLGSAADLCCLRFDFSLIILKAVYVLPLSYPLFSPTFACYLHDGDVKKKNNLRAVIANPLFRWEGGIWLVSKNHTMNFRLDYFFFLSTNKKSAYLNYPNDIEYYAKREKRRIREREVGKSSRKNACRVAAS